MDKREIKFRAWDKNKKIMVCDGDTKWNPLSYPVSVTSIGIKFCKKLESDTSIKDENGTVGYTDWEYDQFAWKEIELMQFTGLKDKNGKEIYEGDIVKLKEELLGIRWQGDGYYQNPCFCPVSLDRVDNGSFGFDSWSEVEVIGNIYENPELLPTKE